jgi:hypothetical protein
MIQPILKKAIEALKGGNGKSLEELSGRVTYVLGMLETLYELQESIQDKQPIIMTKQDGTYKKFEPPKVPDVPLDEGGILDAKARAALETVKKLGGTTI